MLSVEFLILISGLSLAALSAYLFTSALFKSDNNANSLAWATGDEPQNSKSGFINFSRPLVHNFTLQHAFRVKAPAYRKKVERKILTAGLGAELNVDEFIGLQILWGIMFPFMLVVLNFALQLGYSYWMFPGFALFGAMFPHVHCQSSKNSRYVAVIRELPFFIDLMALSTEAGLDFVNSIQRIIDKADDTVLANELSIVLKDIKLGSPRAEALRKLAERLDIPEVTSFTSVVIDADYTGASISQVLKDQSIQMRLERFLRAEKAGAKASQLILVPMMIFILPAVFIIVFAPVILQFFYGGN